jgi:hypothetical protein
LDAARHDFYAPITQKKNGLENHMFLYAAAIFELYDLNQNRTAAVIRAYTYIEFCA